MTGKAPRMAMRSPTVAASLSLPQVQRRGGEGFLRVWDLQEGTRDVEERGDAGRADERVRADPHVAVLDRHRRQQHACAPL